VILATTTTVHAHETTDVNYHRMCCLSRASVALKPGASMKLVGPPLQRLMRRIAETPADFLDEPRIGKQGRLEVAALVNDCLRKKGYITDTASLQRFISNSPRSDRNRLQMVALVTWVLADDWFVDNPLHGPTLLSVLQDDIAMLAESIQRDPCLHDSERREELARFLLSSLNYRPEGETEEQSIDRLSALSSTERQRLLKKSKVAERRAREIRDALAKKAAQEAADKATRE